MRIAQLINMSRRSVCISTISANISVQCAIWYHICATDVNYIVIATSRILFWCVLWMNEWCFRSQCCHVRLYCTDYILGWWHTFAINDAPGACLIARLVDLQSYLAITVSRLPPTQDCVTFHLLRYILIFRIIFVASLVGSKINSLHISRNSPVPAHFFFPPHATRNNFCVSRDWWELQLKA